MGHRSDRQIHTTTHQNLTYIHAQADIHIGSLQFDLLHTHVDESRTPLSWSALWCSYVSIVMHEALGLEGTQGDEKEEQEGTVVVGTSPY